MTPEKIIDLGFCTINIQEHFAVSTIAEGVILDATKLDQLFEIFSFYYQDKPFISIANRVKDYTIDPNLLSSKKHPNLIALLVVAPKKTSKEVVLFERQFYSGVFEIFDTLEEAEIWAEEFLENYLKKAGL